MTKQIYWTLLYVSQERSETVRSSRIEWFCIRKSGRLRSWRKLENFGTQLRHCPAWCNILTAIWTSKLHFLSCCKHDAEWGTSHLVTRVVAEAYIYEANVVQKSLPSGQYEMQDVNLVKVKL